MAGITDRDVFDYHARGRPGKIEVTPTKPLDTQRDLSLAYTPGVARVVEEIERRPEAAFDYTARGNLVAVISNGTAILGLGDRGPLASKPVMEGKAVLFKRFADVDVFDLEIDAPTVDEMVAAVKAVAPTFGGINLEDIKAPECFAVEERLKRVLDIPVFHDDQHGTAIISGAALLGGLALAGKSIGDVKVVISGAGAAALASAAFYLLMGVDPARLRIVDTAGVVHRGRAKNMNPHKERFAVDTGERSLADALSGADVFLGLSAAGVLTPALLATMAPRPIVFACANPEPEIGYEAARAARPDALVGTGRSDCPNQINNVLGPVHIPRRPGRAGPGHHRGHEAGRLARPGRARARARARLRAGSLRRRAHRVRPRVPDPQAARPADHQLGSTGGRARGRGGRRGPRAGRPGGLPEAADGSTEALPARVPARLRRAGLKRPCRR
jgi:malate dehydrogenase (oxaloacetate-decarboxylating)(NADP+)